MHINKTSKLSETIGNTEEENVETMIHISVGFPVNINGILQCKHILKTNRTTHLLIKKKKSQQQQPDNNNKTPQQIPEACQKSNSKYSDLHL